MSVYTNGAEAYGDTTKWLTAFLPVATVISAGLLVGPGLLRSLEGVDSAAAWLESNWLVLLCVIVAAASVAGIIWRGAVVLAVEPTDIGALAGGAAGQVALAKAIGNGAAAPYFFTPEAFDEAMSKLANAWDNDSIAADDPLLPPAVEALREWSVLHQVKAPYRCFVTTFIVGSVLIAGSIAVSAAVTSTSAEIIGPTTVRVSVDRDATDDFTTATGCTSPETTATGCTSPENSSFTAVGGTWDHPRLEVDGPDCRFAARWTPAPSQIELRLPSE